MSAFSKQIDKRHKAEVARLSMPFKSFLVLLPVISTNTQKKLKKLMPPKTIAKVEVPRDLQQVTYATLCRLQRLGDGKDYAKVVCEICEVVCGINEAQVMKATAGEVLGVVAMVQREMVRIADLFRSLKAEHTSEEIQAGVETLNFGTFGIVDWYCKRMGITDHEDGYNTKWQRIYECMRIDHEQSLYEARLRKVYDNKSKHKGGRK